MADSTVAKVDSPARGVATGSSATRSGQDLGRRRTAAQRNPDKPTSPRAAGHGGSTQTMMRLYTNDETPGLRVDPLVVLVLAVVFIFSVVGLHLLHKVIRFFTK